MENAAAGLLILLLAAGGGSSGDIPYFSQGVVGLSVIGSLLVLWRFQRSLISPLSQRANETEKRLTREALGRRECEWRLTGLIEYLRSEGLAVPDHILYGKPPWKVGDDD